MRDENEFIERRIITGLIISTEYLKRVQSFWNISFLESAEIRTVANWCMSFFKNYGVAPDTNIQAIFMEEMKKNKIKKADAQYIEQLLESLSEEYSRDKQFNSSYLYDQTVKYFKSQEMIEHNRNVQALTESGEIEKAEQMVRDYKPTILDDVDIGIDLSHKSIVDKIERAFNETSQPVITYPGALGNMWNEHLTRGSFVTLLAPEKRGKSFMLLEMAMKAIRSKANVAFFEAGDMTESQILKRICIYVARRSDKEKYCGDRYRSVGDCVFNQIDNCNRKDRNCDHGIFENTSLESYYRDRAQYMNMETLQERYVKCPDYEPCKSYTCKKRQGSVWIKKVDKIQPLDSRRAKIEIRKFFKKYKRRFKLTCYPAGFLTVTEIRKCLDNWEKNDNFVPDVIVIDYADLLSADDGKSTDFRHKQDQVWKSLRALSQEKHVLLLSATQADSLSYKTKRLTLSNFSEDKRKLAHVTAQYGLNQDPQGQEKKLGILRVNEIVVREGEFSNDNEVYVLQDLGIGRPFLESFSSTTKGNGSS